MDFKIIQLFKLYLSTKQNPLCGLLNHHHNITGRSCDSSAREGHAAHHRVHGGERRRAAVRAAAAAAARAGVAARRGAGHVAERPAAHLLPQLRRAAQRTGTLLPLARTHLL